MGKGTKAVVYIIIAALILGGGGLWARRARERRLVQERPEVTMARLSEGDVRLTLTLTGKAEPLQRATLKSLVAGKLLTVASEGTVVAENQVVATVQNGPNITAPFPGLIISSGIAAGELVTAGQNLLVLANNNTIVIRTTIDELDYHRISLGQEVQVTFEAVPGRSFTGQVTRKALEARAQGDISLFDIWIEVSQPTDVMLGMTADCEIVFAEARGVLRAPNEAVFYEDGVSYLYVVDGEMNVKKQAIEVGVKNVSFTEITSGVAVNTRVVTSNLGQVVEGGKVRLRQAQRNNPGLLFRR